MLSLSRIPVLVLSLALLGVPGAHSDAPATPIEVLTQFRDNVAKGNYAAAYSFLDNYARVQFVETMKTTLHLQGIPFETLNYIPDYKFFENAISSSAIRNATIGQENASGDTAYVDIIEQTRHFRVPFRRINGRWFIDSALGTENTPPQ